MRQKTKKLMSSLLVVAMLITVLPITALAAENDLAEGESTNVTEDAEYTSVIGETEEAEELDGTTPPSGESEDDDSAIEDSSLAEPDDEENSEEAEQIIALSDDEAELISDTVYKDGTYTGSGTGYGGTITVTVTISDGKITNITEVSQNETAPYWARAAALFDTIIDAQSTEVDGVSGATRSSNGIKTAVSDALAQAAAAASDEDDEAVFSSGSGTENDPYVINTSSQLINFALSVDEGATYAGEYVVLGTDIDLSDCENWNPIGSETDSTIAFSGSFDGQGYTISGMTIDIASESTSYTYVGFFSTLGATASVSNVNITGAEISVTSDANGRVFVLAGAITAYTARASTSQYLLIQNCCVDGEIYVDVSGMAYAGGVVGQTGMYAAIINCVTDVTIHTQSNGSSSYAGGIAAICGNNGMIINCAALGDVSSVSVTTKNSYAAGIAGMMPGKMYNCYAYGDITVGNIDGDATGAGALVGMATMKDTAGALRDYNYYAADAVITVITYSDGNAGSETTVATVDCGQTMGSSMVSTPSTVSEMKSSDFAETLNNNMYEVQKLMNVYSLPSVELNTWVIEDGIAQPAGEVWASDRVDETIFASGDGTEESPYLIETADQLRAFALSMTDNFDYTGVYVALANDIDISGKNWDPVGQSYYIFNGSFDGQGHTISGLTEGSEEAPLALTSKNIYIGLFGVIGPDSVIKNLTLTDVSVYLTYEATAYAGGIAAVTTGNSADYTGAVIDNCSVSGVISLTSSNGNNFVGGIAAMQIKGAIINCATNVDLSCTVNSGYIAEVGGLVGLNNRGLIANSYTLGDVYGSGSRENGNEGMASISALVGVQAGALVNCYSYGSHTTKEYSQYVGAVSGWVTGIGKSYTCWYNGDASMTIGTQKVLPVESIGTKVTSGVNEDGDQYTGGIVDALTAFTSDTYASIVDGLNSSFASFPIDITLYGIETNALRSWTYEGGVVTLGSENAVATYVQPDCELVPVTERTLQNGVWYGRSEDKESVVKITVEDSKLVSTEVISGENEGDSYDEAIEKAVEKSLYGDTTSYYAADTTKFSGGDGTEESPYLISNEAQLRYLAESINEDVDWENVWFKLTADIDVSSSEWLPIGWAIKAEINGRSTVYSAYPFHGNFDGGDYTISGLTIGSEDNPSELYTAGLFGIVEGEYADNNVPENGERAVVLKNIHLTDVNIHVTHRYDTYVGGLVGCGQDGIIIDNCSVTGTIESITEESASRAGGLMSYALYGVITNCWTDVDLNISTADGTTYGGGMIASTNRVTIVNCYALGNVTSDAGNNNKIHIGGFTGMEGGISINCYAAGDVIAKKPTTDVGGLSGRLAGIGVNYNCYYSSDAVQRNGDTTNEENVAFGVAVETALDKTEGKTAAELASKDFAKLLNENRTNIDETVQAIQEHLNGLTLIHSIYYNGEDLLKWALANGVVCFASEEKDDNNSNNNSSSNSGNGGATTTPTVTTPTTTEPEPVNAAEVYNDVEETDWYIESVNYVVENGLMNGYDETTFAPNDNLSRAMLMTIIARIDGVDTDSGETWYEAGMAWAVENGISDGSNPLVNITREQLVTMLYRYAGSPEVSGTLNFKDISEISGYAVDAMTWAVQNGILKGTDVGTLNPQNSATRAEAAAILARFCENVKK